MNEEKVFCPQCKCTLIKEKFYKNKSRANGCTAYCIECSKSRAKEYQLKNIKKITEYQKEYGKKYRSPEEKRLKALNYGKKYRKVNAKSIAIADKIRKSKNGDKND